MNEGHVPHYIRRKSARILVLVGINLALLLIAAAGFELLFGNWALSYVPPHSVSIDRTFRYHQELYDPPGDILYVRDRYALRGVRESLAEIQLVTLGGSTTDQKFITEGQTWQDVIRSQSGMPTANAGVDGMSSSGHVIAVTEWLHRLPDFHPAYYLHYIGVNDSLLSRETLVGDRSGTSSWTRSLRRRSAIAQTLGRAWDLARGPQLIMHGQVRPADWAKLQFTEAKVDRTKVLAYIDTVYRPNLRTLLALHRSHGERAILVSQPLHPLAAIYKEDAVFIPVPSVAQLAVSLPMINGATKAICGEQAEVCRFVDLARELRFDPADFYDEVHATPPGARKIGMFLAEKLMRLRQDRR
jgi:hypothetical protein